MTGTCDWYTPFEGCHPYKNDRCPFKYLFHLCHQHYYIYVLCVCFFCVFCVSYYCVINNVKISILSTTLLCLMFVYWFEWFKSYPIMLKFFIPVNFWWNFVVSESARIYNAKHISFFRVKNRAVFCKLASYCSVFIPVIWQLCLNKNTVLLMDCGSDMIKNEP